MALVSLTEKAREKVEGFRAGIADADEQAMWIEVTGIQAGAFTYNLSLKPLAGATPDDHVEQFGGLSVVVPARDADALRGATVDWSEDLMSGGLTVDNPNTPSPAMAPPPADLGGPVAQRVMQVIEQQINPSIAMHGGSAELVAVEEPTAYVRLGGGCVGCGMATVTLSQGIEVAITEAIPEITSVIDVTDHASGTNPSYEAAKK
jgi:Fe/S biogenesis protein NfuA